MDIITLTGPSCGGKTTFQSLLLHDKNYISIVSHTTRMPRQGEIESKDYHFVSTEIFEDMLINGKFMEHIHFNGSYYGVSSIEAEKAAESGKTVVLIVDPNGLEQILKYYSGTETRLYTIYIDGGTEELITRYLVRASGENLSDPKVSVKHARRLESLIEEQHGWHPEVGVYKVKYDLIIPSLGPENTEEVINTIKEEAFK